MVRTHLVSIHRSGTVESFFEADIYAALTRIEKAVRQVDDDFRTHPVIDVKRLQRKRELSWQRGEVKVHLESVSLAPRGIAESARSQS